MNSSDILLRPGTLWPAIEERTRLAIRNGALETIQTEEDIVEDQGIRFLVRSVSSLRRKSEEKAGKPDGERDTRRPANPFLPPEPALTVADISVTHLAVLNKFNVINRHLLMVTRRFEHQEIILTPEDFLAFWVCLTEFDGLGFYNGGEAAGASQAHKHLQMVPLPLSGQGPKVPMDALFSTLNETDEISRIPHLPWQHRLVRLDDSLVLEPLSAAEYTHALYRAMVREMDLESIETSSGNRQSRPYNLLMTRDFLTVIPRKREYAEGISINALGFAGSLFVPDRRKMNVIRESGPMNLLRQVSYPNT